MISTSKENKIKVCNRCVMDTTASNIQFDSEGICNYCNAYFAQQKKALRNEKELDKIVATIKEEGKRKKYDCIIGVSGGVDSTYVAYYVKKLGLRPLAVHLDNGWDANLMDDRCFSKVTDVWRTIVGMYMDEFFGGSSTEKGRADYKAFLETKYEVEWQPDTWTPMLGFEVNDTEPGEVSFGTRKYVRTMVDKYLTGESKPMRKTASGCSRVPERL